MSHAPRPRVRLAALASTLALALAACGGGDDGGPKGPSAFVKTAGDGVQASVASPTPAPPTVKVTDSDGGAVRGVVVNFAVTSGGGSITTAVDTTDASGLASAGTWTLGSATGQQTVTATSPVLSGTSAVFTATAVAGPPTQLVFITQPAVAAIVGEPFQGPVIEIRDQFGNRTSSTATVTVSLGGNNGPAPITAGVTSVAAVDGRATFGQLTTGTSGSLTMIATANVASIAAATSNAIAVASGPPAALQKVSGDVQLGGAGAAAFLPPTVRVVDAGGNGIAGITVTFAVQSGGGSVSGASAVSDGSGLARVGSWTLGPAAGANVLRATVGALQPADFEATGDASSPYHIQLKYINTPTRAQQLAFERAWQRWRDIIRTEATDVTQYATQAVNNPCGITGQVLNEVVDDIVIFVNLRPIDGVGQVLGSAGPCAARVVGGNLSLVTYGAMNFDTADLAQLEANGTLESVILHEMGHVFGIGSLWGSNPGYGMLTGAGTETSSFTGANARAAWEVLGGAVGTNVPVENCVGQPSTCTNGGTRDVHWRESVFDRELMTGYTDPGGMPLSALTIASLRDIGFTVDASRADAFTLPTAPPGGSGVVAGGSAGGASGIRLAEAPWTVELQVVDMTTGWRGTITEWQQRRNQRLGEGSR